MRWLLRLVFVRLLGRRAVPILALVGLVTAIRGARSRDVRTIDSASGSDRS